MVCWRHLLFNLCTAVRAYSMLCSRDQLTEIGATDNRQRREKSARQNNATSEDCCQQSCQAALTAVETSDEFVHSSFNVAQHTDLQWCALINL